MGPGAPRGGAPRGPRQCPERARRLARDKGAVLRAVAAWVPPGAEVLVAAEFGHVDWTRAAPVLLEHEIGDDPGRERKRHQHEHDGPAGDDERPALPDEFAREARNRRCPA